MLVTKNASKYKWGAFVCAFMKLYFLQNALIVIKNKNVINRFGITLVVHIYNERKLGIWKNFQNFSLKSRVQDSNVKKVIIIKRYIMMS